jgi:hypothetical protein
MRTIVYVDAFNLYYGCLRDTPFRWLDLAGLCRHLLAPQNVLVQIKYFTARVRGRPGNPGQPNRQQLYLRALRTLPEVSIYYGHYITQVARMPLAVPSAYGSRFVEVLRTEEKGSDVNLATEMVSDAYERRFDLAVVVSNDSDLLAPIQLVRQRIGRPVGVLNPHRHPSLVLARAATFVKQIRPGVLAASQFPDVLTDRHGTIRKPGAWGSEARSR